MCQPLLPECWGLDMHHQLCLILTSIIVVGGIKGVGHHHPAGISCFKVPKEVTSAYSVPPFSLFQLGHLMVDEVY